MREHALSLRYAKALFELACKRQVETKIGEELLTFSGAICGQKKVSALFENPVLGDDEKKNLLGRVTKEKMDPLAGHFLSLLIKKKRFGLLGSISNCYRELLNHRRGVIETNITTARPLDAGLKQLLHKALEKKLEKKIILREKVDASLLGGISVQVRGQLLDGSIRAQLQALKQQVISLVS